MSCNAAAAAGCCERWPVEFREGKYRYGKHHHQGPPAGQWRRGRCLSLLAARQLEVAIGGRTLCRDLSVELKAGSVWGLLGGNGAGKTTLLHTLAGLRKPQAGTIELRQQEMHELSHRQRALLLGMLLQDEHIAFPATVLETALLGRHPHLAAWQWESSHDLALVTAALQQVQLQAMAERQLSELSGGERQRLKIATLMVQDPDIWLLDEPTNHLDLNHQIQMLSSLCQRVRDKGGTLLMSLHDLQLADRFCDRLILLYPDGELEQGPVAELLESERLSRLYKHPIRCLQTDEGRVFIPQ